MEIDIRSDQEELEEQIFSDDLGEQTYEKVDLPTDRTVVTTPYDAPVRTLLEEIRDKTLIVNPPFQRQSVWKPDRQSRLIESLLLNIPIPVLYFAEDEDGSRVVVDGQQRLRAIDEYFSGQYRLQKLEVLSELNGKRWTDLTPKHSRTIQTRTLRCVVISAASPQNLRFEMFERLNTGSVPLNDQELRNCISQGRLNTLLNQIVTSKEWLAVIQRTEPDSRLRHHELVLRFFALHHALDNYRPPLKKVLNDYMRDNRNPDDKKLVELSALFFSALRNVHAVFGEAAFRKYSAREDGSIYHERYVNRAVFDVQMLSLVEIPREQVATKLSEIRELFISLCTQNEEFASALSLSTAKRSSFYSRLSTWSNALVETGIAAAYAGRLPSTVSD